jgi:hypothetical protein
MATAFAIKMGVGLMMPVWCQAIMKRASAATESFYNSLFYQKIQDSVDRNPVYVNVARERFKYLPSV